MTAKQFVKKLAKAREIAHRCNLVAWSPPAWVLVMLERHKAKQG